MTASASLRRARRFLALSALALVSYENLAVAEEANRGRAPLEKETRASAPERPNEMPLSLLPEPPKTDQKTPRPAALEAIDGLLLRIASEDEAVRQQARTELVEAKPDWTAGLGRRIDTIVERADKEAMRALLDRIKKSERRKGDDEDAEGGGDDYLTFVLNKPAPASRPWKDLAQVLAVNRMLAAVGSPDAMREMVRLYARFGEFLRLDVQRELEKLGDRAVAGYLEAQNHQAPKISAWAKKRLVFLKKTTPNEAVRTKDPEALAAILVALGRTRDPECARVLLSFASTERSQVRLAARQGIALLGEVAAWQLRDAYQDTTGRNSPREWTWKRTARELFTEYDRLRLAKVFELFEAARAKEKEGNLPEMARLYDEVLAFSPLFEEREVMVPGYLAFAEKVRESDPKAAILALRKVERLAPTASEREKAESVRHVLEARLLAAEGTVDRGLIDKAIALDPESPLAKAALETPSGEGLSTRSRYLLAFGAIGLSLLGVAWITAITLRARRALRTEDPDEASPLPPEANDALPPSEGNGEPDSPEARDEDDTASDLPKTATSANEEGPGPAPAKDENEPASKDS